MQLHNRLNFVLHITVLVVSTSISIKLDNAETRGIDIDFLGHLSLF